MEQETTQGSVSAGADLTDSNIATGDRNRIRRGGDHTQSVTMSTDRDIAALLFSVERETQVIHREIAAVKDQLQNAVYVGLFFFLIVFGVAVFVGDRQIDSLSRRLHDVELQMQRVEQQLSRDGSAPYPYPYTEP